MNQTVYYNTLKIILSFIFIFPLKGKLLKPSINGEKKEILLIGSKRRIYYPVRNDDNIVYSLRGPTRLEFISRYPVLKKKKKSHRFRYKIVLNEQDTININHRYKIQKSIKSVQHPRHSYTYSGNYFINLKEGNHNIQILGHDKNKYPVLVRLISKEFESVGKNKKIITPMVHQKAVSIFSGKKEINYFECNSDYDLQIKTKGPNTLRILSRLEFTDSMGPQESYRIRVKEGSRVLGTYFFNSERSSVSQIIQKPEIVPGKWRSCEIVVPDGNHVFTIEVPDKKKNILTRYVVHK